MQGISVVKIIGGSNVSSSSNNSFTDEYDLILSISEPHFVYGYGYGHNDSFNITSSQNPYLMDYPGQAHYFDVLDINGFESGFGVVNTDTPYLGDFSYGWGYENSYEVVGDGIDSITINATVYKNGVVVDGVEVYFEAEHGIVLSSMTSTTQNGGVAAVTAKIDLDIKRNIDSSGENPVFVDRPIYGFIEIFASINQNSQIKNWAYNIPTISYNSYGAEFVTLFTVQTFCKNKGIVPSNLLGSGTELDPFQISEITDLMWMQNHVSESSGKYYKLLNDIDASETLNEGISFGTIGDSKSSFNGIMDGDGHVISNLGIVLGAEAYVGLFGIVGNSGEVKNIGIDGGDIKGDHYVGGIVGYNFGKVTNCFFVGTVMGIGSSGIVGGIVGNNEGGVISKCYSSGYIYGTSLVGGIVGLSTYNNILISYGAITNSYSTSEITVSNYIAGGISGNGSINVVNCYAAGKIVCTGNNVDGDYIGGIIGFPGYPPIASSKSYWDIESTKIETSSNGGFGKTTSQMKQQGTFVDWDFIDVWGISSEINNGYPYLKG